MPSSIIFGKFRLPTTTPISASNVTRSRRNTGHSSRTCSTSLDFRGVTALTNRKIEKLLDFDGDDSTVEGLSDDDVEVNEHLESCLQELEDSSEGSIDDSSDDDIPLADVAARLLVIDCTSSTKIILFHIHQEFSVNL
ncbi:hypothetical protein EVAR_41077_1 [Eumeta japonica]|uniref:Uncharacterized protein n=1 Tax=Eumeta variegata TaxID=151549 RepID=A0A4C1XTG1_EUMVA|nr:hypothetical protein EVAR_41077_1 [Eumeta japonica]